MNKKYFGEHDDEVTHIDAEGNFHVDLLSLAQVIGAPITAEALQRLAEIVIKQLSDTHEFETYEFLLPEVARQLRELCKENQTLPKQLILHPGTSHDA